MDLSSITIQNFVKISLCFSTITYIQTLTFMVYANFYQVHAVFQLNTLLFSLEYVV